MYNTNEKIKEIESMLERYKDKHNKIENANYILSMQLDRIYKGELKSVEDVIKWDFEMVRVGEECLGIINTVQ